MYPITPIHSADIIPFPGWKCAFMGSAKLQPVTDADLIELNPGINKLLLKPLPLAWIAKASRLGNSSLKTALALWYVHSLQSAIMLSNRHRGEGIYITRQASELFNITRNCEREGLKRLETAGLVRVTRKPGSKARVLLRFE